MQSADNLGPRGQRSVTLLLYEVLAQVPQGQVDGRFLVCTAGLADRTVLGWFPRPPLLQAGLAEAVAARQEDWGFKDVTAHGTGELLFLTTHTGGHVVRKRSSRGHNGVSILSSSGITSCSFLNLNIHSLVDLTLL